MEEDTIVSVENALIRCRTAAVIEPPFEYLDRGLGLWVWELGPFGNTSWHPWMLETCKLLSSRLPLLKNLKNKSEDYTLHIAVSCRNEIGLVDLSPQPIGVAAEAGFSIEPQIERE